MINMLVCLLVQLSRSGTIGETEPGDGRVSHTSWLDQFNYPIVEKLSRRVSMLTGLHTYEGPYQNMAGESLQVLEVLEVFQ